MRAVILCAGYGTRLGELTKETPKPMLAIRDKPLLEYLIMQLRFAGVGEIAINLHYKPEVIKNYFGDGKKFGVNITYFFEEKLLGTAGALAPMQAWLKEGGDDFFVIYGDILTNEDFATFIDFHRQKKAFATLLVHESPKSNSTLIMDADNRIRILEERPKEGVAKILKNSGDKITWANSGVQILNLGIVDEIIKTKAYDLPRDIYARFVHLKPIYGKVLSGDRLAIDSPERLEKAQTMQF